MKIRSALLFVSLMVLCAVDAMADTVISVTGSSTVNAWLSDNQALATGWTQAATYTVDISVEVGGGDGTFSTAYLTTRIGPGTTISDEIDRIDFQIPQGGPALVTLFTAKTLPPGTYYLVLENKYAGNGGWYAQGDVTTASGVSSAGDFTADPSSYAPSSAFYSVNSGLRFTVTDGPGLPDGSISGKVIDSDGTGLAGVDVAVYFSGSWSFAGRVTTDSAGCYTISLPTGTYYLRTWNNQGYVDEYYDNVVSQDAADTVWVGAGSETPGVNFALAAGGTISGRVTRDSDETGISGVNIATYTNDWSFAQNTRTDSSGNYSITLPPGSYYLRTFNNVYADEYYNNVTSQSLADPVQVTVGTSIPNVDFSLGMGGSISGKVTGDSDAIGIPDVHVEAYDSSWNWFKWVATDSSGRYTIPGLPAGDYFITTSNGQGFEDEYYDNVPSRDAASPVQVAAGTDTPNVDIGLARYGSVSGRVVRDSDGTPLPDLVVFAFNSNGQPVRDAGTDSSGDYSITGLESGTYYIGTWDNAALHGFFDVYYDNVAYLSAATAVVVHAGMDIPNINLRLAIPGSISGMVTRDSDGTGIPGIDVVAYNLDWSPAKSAVTDSSGSYQITGLVGSYYLRTWNDSGMLDEYYNNVYSESAATPVIVEAETDTSDINIGLGLGGSISGRVTRDTDGTGIPGISVSAYDLEATEDNTLHFVKSTVTDSSGNYSITGLASGSYYLQTSNSLGYGNEMYDNATSSWDATAVPVILGRDTQDINFELGQGGAISGRVTRAADGTGIAGMDVFVFNSTWTSGTGAYTDSSGNYRVGNLTPGDYYVYTSNNRGLVDLFYSNVTHQGAATTVAVTGGNTALIDFSLTIGGSVSGRITRDTDGTGISAVQVHAYDGSWNPIKSVASNSSGYYSLSGLPPGNLYLKTSNGQGLLDEYYDGVTSTGSATAVAVTAGAASTNINFGLRAGGSISGKVSRDSDGTGISDVQIYVWDSSWHFVEFVTSSTSGDYSVTGLSSGNYYLQTWNAQGFTDEYYNNAASRNTAIALAVTAGTDTSNVNFGLALGGSISGRVFRDSDGTGISGAHVYAYDSNWIYVKSGNSDLSGAYTISGLPPGDYYTQTWNDQGFINEYYSNANSQSSATPIAVTAGTNASSISFGLARGALISGQVVRDSDGIGIPGIHVYVYNSNWSLVRDVSTDPSGSYMVSGLPAGSYYLKTGNAADQGFLDEFYDNSKGSDSATPIGVSAGSTFVINFTLRQKPTPNADFDSNGIADILWRNRSTGEIYVWYINGGMRTGGSHIQSLPDPDWRIAGIADFNEDDKSDILWRNQATGDNCVWFMDGIDLAGGGCLDQVDDVNWTIAGVADFDSNGKPDVLWSNISTGENYVWFMNGTNPTGGEFLDPARDVTWRIAGLGDFNDDGKPDILWRNRSTGENNVWFLNGTTATGEAALEPVPDLNWKIVSVEDYDKDGQADIVWRNSRTGEDRIWIMDGTDLREEVYLDQVTDSNWLISDKGETVIGPDFNNDDNADVLWRNSSTGENYVWFMNGKDLAGGAFLQPVEDTDWKIAATADFDLDGRTDILWRNDSTGDNSVWFMHGTNVNGGARLLSVPEVDWRIAGAADFTGDKKPDILWRNVASGENYIWFMDGATRIGGEYLLPVEDLNWKIVGVGDFNGDGESDILWRNAATGENYIWYMEGTSRASGEFLQPLADTAWEIAAVADYNKDRNPDLLWRNESTGENYVWFMDGIIRTGGDFLPQVPEQSWSIASERE